jgi:hypothetical protein
MVHAAFIARISPFIHSSVTSDRQIKSSFFFLGWSLETIIMDNFTRPLRIMSRTLAKTNGKGISVHDDANKKFTKSQIPTSPYCHSVMKVFH